MEFTAILYAGGKEGGRSMDGWRILDLLGGIALFLYGMELLGAALKKLAGGRMQTTLEHLTSSRARGFLLGLVVTAVIQSSSATMVMVLGFINSGLMQLAQACGVIIGANVGTTVTAWLLSTAGVTGTGGALNFLKPSAFVPALAVIGILQRMLSKRERTRNIAAILLGFSVLMLGMEAMSGAVEPLSSDPAFLKLTGMFSSPIPGLMIGMAMTAVLQSSSAAVGILQALSMTGAISFSAAIPILMGQNIGASAPVLLSAIGGRRETKRAALMYLLFNVFGAAIVMAAYWPARALVSGMDAAVNPLSLAWLHTGSKLLMTAILMPASGAMMYIAHLLIPDRDAAEAGDALDERLLETPAVALEQCRKMALGMAEAARRALMSGMALLKEWSDERAREVDRLEERLDRDEDGLGTYLVRLSDCALSPAESRENALLLHLIGDFERIGDHAVNLKEAAEELREKRIQFSEEAAAELDVLMRAVRDLLDAAIGAFAEGDTARARRVEPLEQVVDDLTKELKSRHIDRLRGGKCTIELGFVLADAAANLERVADHCSNVAAALIETALGSMDLHDYTEHVGESAEFREQYHKDRAEYALPAARR